MQKIIITGRYPFIGTQNRKFKITLLRQNGGLFRTEANFLGRKTSNTLKIWGWGKYKKFSVLPFKRT